MIPTEVITVLEKELTGLSFGEVCLRIGLHDGKVKFRITKETSFIPGKPTSGAGGRND